MDKQGEMPNYKQLSELLLNELYKSKIPLAFQVIVQNLLQDR
jgi:hypothetical protein